ncbi:hypothetical protein FACS189431_0320 [Alphaproteobacteria bacterium]|nr:hypothetical protein FACS189431_0320 [Alphaproteobacteria bacterium]
MLRKVMYPAIKITKAVRKPRATDINVGLWKVVIAIYITTLIIIASIEALEPITATPAMFMNREASNKILEPIFVLICFDNNNHNEYSGAIEMIAEE